MLIDIHSHLDHCYFKDDLDKVIDNAKKANVKVILTAGINPEKNIESLEISIKYDIVKACLGIYPIQYENNNNYDYNKKINQLKNNFNNKKHLKINNVNNHKNKYIEKIKIKNNEKLNIDEEIEFIEKNKKNIVAIGEVGLDYFWEKEKINEQKKLFEKMIQLAEKLSKPIIVHSRKAENDTIEKIAKF